jgi:hypothetical protein
MTYPNLGLTRDLGARRIVSHIVETKEKKDALKPQPKIHTKYITPKLLFNENIKQC